MSDKAACESFKQRSQSRDGSSNRSIERVVSSLCSCVPISTITPPQTSEVVQINPFLLVSISPSSLRNAAIAEMKSPACGVCSAKAEAVNPNLSRSPWESISVACPRDEILIFKITPLVSVMLLHYTHKGYVLVNIELSLVPGSVISHSSENKPKPSEDQFCEWLPDFFSLFPL